ncbi:insulinase family protein [Alteromonas sediminis]|uniref:Insulinase family protein n=1 Tax=Alteromonas sediminis TaxID=2259342 RepID=A0A3N5XWX5_9ALTE|nr:pitrilysin family protein [Alteromonas sediminis]RPJ64930.1 insulinase family protein [Alteromonas sediminis]
MRLVKVTSLLLLCSSLLLSVTVHADKLPERIHHVEGISEYRLDNGLQVLLFPDQTQETVTVNVTYRVGSKHENYGETGMAHLLEHLVFKGSTKHPNITAELTERGARPNGTTWTDRTNYFETFNATEDNIEWALSMESDRMVNSFIRKEDLDSEMTVVRNEFERGENSPFRVTLQKMLAAAYEWHNYGKSTIGARSDIENVPIDRLKAFYTKYYQPDNATLIVAGKFEEEDMLKRVVNYFGPIPKPERVLPEVYTQEPAQAGEKSVIVRRVGDAQFIGAGYHIPAGSHTDFAAISVLNQIIGNTPNGRLYKNLVEAGLASRTYGFNFQWEEPGFALFFAEVDKAADITATQEALLSTVEGIAGTPVTEEEVERAKRNILKNIELSFNSSQRIALGLSEWVGMGDWRLYFLNRDRVEAVKIEDVQRVAEAYLVRNNRTLGKFVPSEQPERVEIPKVDDVANMLEGYKGRESIAQGEVFEPSYDNIDARTETVSLENGTELSLLSKKTRGESVSVNLLMRFGNESALNGKADIAGITGSMLLRGGAGLTRQQIQDEFDKLKAQVSVFGGVDFGFTRITTTRENLPATLQLLSKILKKPSFSKEEFEQLKATRKVDIEQNMQDPQRLAFNAYSRVQNPYPKGHPFYVNTFEESLAALESVTLDQVKAFYNDFYGTSNMEVGVIGDFDVAQVTDIFKQHFTDWKSPTTFENIEKPFTKVKPSVLTFDTPDKENATFVAALMLPVGENHADAPALELANYIFGGGFLSSRLATRLRQEDGLSYGAGSFISFESKDEKATMGAYAIAAPQNLAKVEQGFREELARLVQDGFTAEEVESAKAGLLQQKKVSRSQDGELVGTLRRNLFLDRTMQWYEDYDSRLANLTVEDLNKVVRAHLDIEKFTIISAGDMNKAKAE